ncbi:MAG: response regulator [Gammaproteobacteria bacterium]|jgi:FixJ family two-component response regulator
MSNRREQTVFIVDDDAAVRDSIRELVESVGLKAEAYPSALAFLEMFQPQRSGCLVLDVRMAEMSGLVLQQKLNALGASIPVIMLSGHGDVAMAVQAMKAGGTDFIQKPYPEQALLDSINAALAADARSRCSSRASVEFERRLKTLTAREQEVLNQTLSGSTSKEIAMTLAISPRTVETHRKNILRKLEISTVKLLLSRLASRK